MNNTSKGPTAVTLYMWAGVQIKVFLQKKMMRITGRVEYALTVNQTEVCDQCVHHPGWLILLFCSFFLQQFTCIKIITLRDSTSLGPG